MNVTSRLEYLPRKLSDGSPHKREYGFCLLLVQALKLKRFRFFSGYCFRFYSGLFPALFRNDSRIRPEKHQKQTGTEAETFSGKKRIILSFQVSIRFRVGRIYPENVGKQTTGKQKTLRAYTLLLGVCIWVSKPGNGMGGQRVIGWIFKSISVCLDSLNLGKIFMS